MSAISLDIETTGLSADDEVISWAVFGDKIETCYNQATDLADEKCILETLIHWMKHAPINMTLVTFNGQSYKGGFDFPLLRTRFHKHGIAWPFTGMMHVDIYPVIEKRWNTAVMPAPTLERLKRKEQLIGVANALNIHLESKDTMKVMCDIITKQCTESDITAAIVETQDIKPVDINNLKGAYQIITGKDPGDMDGKESIKLWQQYKGSGDPALLERIREYNLNDCKKTLELYEICQMYCSQRDMQPEVL